MEKRGSVTSRLPPFLLVVWLTAFGGCASAENPELRAGSESFGERYWVRPVPLQGAMPDGFSALESSLYPRDCGACHQSQYADWSGSLHSQAVGPGLTGQLSPDRDPSFAASCYLCHAPMSEQQEYLIVDGQYRKNPSFDERLQKSGVSCGVCHLRGARRFGPPPLKKSPASAVHGGFTPSSFFEESKFCASCHQFPADGFSLNGKLLENTYNEWVESPYPEKGITCQRCHMPGRRHLFRGIHDPEMVKGGVDISVAVKDKGRKGVFLTIVNSNTGHYFPTYVTPLIVVTGALLDETGDRVDGSVKEGYVGRRVALDLSREVEDTRIPPLGRYDFDYLPGDFKEAATVRLEVWVHPDMFYNEFFKASLRGGFHTSKGDIEEALDATERSPYLLYSWEREL